MTPPDTSGDMWLTLREAAEAFDVSLSTLHRRKRSGELEDVGAFKDGDTWKIPRQGLARLGFKELVPPVSPGQVTLEEALSESEDGTVPVTPADTPRDTPDTAEVEQLRAELEEVKRRAAVLEARLEDKTELAEAWKTAYVDAQRRIEAPVREQPQESEPEPAAEPQSAPPEPPQPQRKGWWRRMWRQF